MVGRWTWTMNVKTWYSSPVMKFGRRTFDSSPTTFVSGDMLGDRAYPRSGKQSYKINIFKNFAKFTGKHLCRGLLLIELEVEAWNLIQNRLQHRFIPVNFCESFKNTIFTESWFFSFDRNNTKAKAFLSLHGLL